MELVYVDDDILVCLKPARVLSTDEPGGVPDLCREALGNPKADVRTVHRLDRVVAGLMVLARNARAASELSRQIRVQFASRNMPLVGERKYSERNDPCEIALWSCRLAFTHPRTGERMEFTHEPPQEFPWTEVTV